MAENNNPNTLPDTFNGRPTRYTFFDGFTTSSLVGKFAYVAGFALIPATGGLSLAIPAAMEARAYSNTRMAAKDAQVAQLQETVMQQNAVLNYMTGGQMPQLPQPGLQAQQDMNPSAPQDGRYTQQLQTQRAAAIGPRQPGF